MRREPTPGPWFYVYGAVWTTPDGPEDGGVCVATRASAAPIEPTTKDANMALCALAPELLAALIGLVSMIDAVTQGRESELRAEWLPKARAVIAKVEAI